MLLGYAILCVSAAQFLSGRDLNGYLSDSMLRSAVERKLEIIRPAEQILRIFLPDELVMKIRSLTYLLRRFDNL